VLLGFERHGDVPGAQAPARYFHYTRTGDAGALIGVLNHNRLDLRSLAALTARAFDLIDAGPGGARDTRECLALGRLYERAGQIERAATCYECAARADGDGATRAEALYLLALRRRRDRRHLEAADAWQQILTLEECGPGIREEAIRALAIHHEHRSRDLATAKTFALRLRGNRNGRGEIEYRLARLDRKLGSGQDLLELRAVIPPAATL
jgi:tetratricopeptide (TPR) repeat protein